MWTFLTKAALSLLSNAASRSDTGKKLNGLINGYNSARSIGGW